MHSRIAEPAFPAAIDAAHRAWRPPAAQVGIAADAKVNALVTFMFIVMIASFPIELPQRTFRWEVPTITTTLFLMTTFLQPLACYGRLHPGILSLATYVFVFGLSAITHGWPENTITLQLFLFIVQALLVAWTTYNLMQQDRIARKALWFFVAACVVRTILPMTGLVEHSAYVESATGAERVTAFGQDPNYSAMLLSAALVITLGLTLGPRRMSLTAKLIGWALVAFFAVAIVNTGSRGGLLALVTGLAMFALARARNPIQRARSVAIVVVGMAALGYVVLNSYVMRKRIETTAQEGAMAGRELIFPTLWGMFQERPLAGWGPVNNYYELVLRATDLVKRPEQMSKDPHNLFLELLTSVGLLGTVPFLAAMALAFRGAWKARQGDYGIVPLALMAVFLMANISLNQIAHKPFWMFMAFALAAESRVRRDLPTHRPTSP